MEQIIVGVDGSAASAAALRFALQLAAGGGAEILAVTAYEHPSCISGALSSMLPTTATRRCGHSAARIAMKVLHHASLPVVLVPPATAR